MRRSVIRTLGFFRQWMAEVVRQPWLMVSLVLGPFLILLLFGRGETVGAPRPKAIIVEPAGASQTENPLMLKAQEMTQYLTIVGTTSNAKQAETELVNGTVDLVVIVPPNPELTIAQGQHAHVQIFTNIIDPVQESYAHAYLREQFAVLNQRVVQQTIASAQASVGNVHAFAAQAQRYLKAMQAAGGDVTTAGSQVHQLRAQLDPISANLDAARAAAEASPLFSLPGLDQVLVQLRQLDTTVASLRVTVDQLDQQLSSSTGAVPSAQELAQLRATLSQVDTLATQLKTIPPDVLSAPFQLELRNVSPFVPTPIGFYAPAVLALLLQHLALTLAALSMTRVRFLGLMELFKTSPVKPSEVAVGNYLSYGVLTLVAGALLVALLVFGLGVPVFGSHLLFAATIVLLVTSSLGIGFVISLLSSSEQQAAQLAMLMLIVSTFFSGFLVALNTISWPVRALSYLLPATYAIRTLQDVMLRGVLRTPGDLAVLSVASVVLFLVTVLLVRREFRAT